jgi:hypothetical protein
LFLRNRKSCAFIHLAERVDDLLGLLSEHRLRPKELLFVHPRADAPARLALVPRRQERRPWPDRDLALGFAWQGRPYRPSPGVLSVAGLQRRVKAASAGGQGRVPCTPFGLGDLAGNDAQGVTSQISIFLFEGSRGRAPCGVWGGCPA